MRLTDLLSAERVGIQRLDTPSDKASFTKETAIGLLAKLIGPKPGVSIADVEQALLDREQLQSTGIGEGVAIPHGALPQLTEQVAALLIVPQGVDFQAIDDASVSILFGVITPKRATGEHLKTLARVSRLLRNKEFRQRLINSPDPESVFELIRTEEALAPPLPADRPSERDLKRGASGEGSRSDPPARSVPPPMLDITVSEIVADQRLGIKLTRLAGENGLGRPIRHPRVQKSGLALAGHYYGVVPTRVQVLGETELSYLETLPSDRAGEAARGFFSLGLSCVVVTRRSECPRPIIQAAEATATPLFMSDARSSRSINALHAFLDEKLAPSTSLHGVLVDVFGIGLLLLGKSGIGKSECAVELVLRGHRLVADDVVRCEWRPPGMVFGSPADMLRHHVEVRGLGLLNIKDLFGVTAVRERKRIDMIVRLDEWDEKKEYDRLGVDDEHYPILGTPIRLVTVPVRPGRDMGAMLEMAARNELLRRAGKHSAKELLARLEENVGLAPEMAIEDQPESVVEAPVSAMSSGRLGQPPPPPNSSVAHPGWSDSDRHIPAARITSNESSAWIPVYRPTGGDDKGGKHE